MITFNCACGQAIEVADDMGGKQGRCPKCGLVLTVPPAAGPAAAPTDLAPMPPGNSPPLPPGPWAAAPAAGPGVGVLSIVALVISLVAIPLLVAWGAGLLFSLAGLVLGIVAWVRSSRAKRGAGMAIAATIVSACTILLGALLVAILVPVIGSALREAKTSSCLVNLKTIGGAMREYERSKDAVPSKPWDLVEEGLLPLTAFRCATDDTWQQGQSSYFLHWKVQEGYPADVGTIIACDLKGNHEKGRNCLTRGGNVQWMPEDKFQIALTRPENAPFAAALRAFEATGAKHVILDH
ncbi:MAG: hypothetical protein LLG01_04855 [Planctomycetaceae bacterium]|nr:hypothetical protein [Planctomycetaceae bacterium]